MFYYFYHIFPYRPVRFTAPLDFRYTGLVMPDIFRNPIMNVPRSMFLASVFLLLGGCAGTGKSGMDGGCADYRMNMQREFSLAEGLGIPTLTFASASNGAGAVSTNTKLDVSLYPSNEVQFLVEPEKRGKKAEEFAGLVKVRVTHDWNYRVSTVIPVWIEIATADGRRIKTNNFEMQAQCKKVFKTAVFPLKANTEYWLQMSASREKDTAIIITPEP